MDVKDFVVIIILFIFADLLFYVVVMKGLMVKSIRGKSHADEVRDQPAREDGPAFSAQLRHHDPEPRLSAVSSLHGNLAHALQDSALIMRRELGHLDLEDVRFIAPRDLMVGEPARLELALAQNIVSPITRALNQAAPAKVTTLKIGAHLTALLSGDGFRITPLAASEQGLAAPEAQWAWEVVPLKAGRRALALDLDLSLKIPSSEETLHFAWPECSVQVEPNAYFVLKSFLQRHWKGSLASAGLLAAGLYLWLRG
ncbi:MAG: hypothetical protein Q7U07_04865 [Gammaproteobacteria bacterium]|nr:hypothetical protein [Gammaproteobacteria bacterium]